MFILFIIFLRVSKKIESQNALSASIQASIPVSNVFKPLKMSIFDASTMKELATEWSEKKNHNGSNEFFEKYKQSFLDEVRDHLNSSMTLRDGREVLRKDDLSYKLRILCQKGVDRIQLPFFTYYMTNFGDKQTKSMNGKKEFKSGETYREAAARLGYHTLCQSLVKTEVTKVEASDLGLKTTPYLDTVTGIKKEATTEEAPVTDEAPAKKEEVERPAPKHFVYEFTDLRYKIAEMFGENFTIIKKWRRVPADSMGENFGSADFISSYEVTLFLEYHPDGIADADWLAKSPVKDANANANTNANTSQSATPQRPQQQKKAPYAPKVQKKTAKRT